MRKIRVTLEEDTYIIDDAKYKELEEQINKALGFNDTLDSQHSEPNRERSLPELLNDKNNHKIVKEIFSLNGILPDNLDGTSTSK